MPQIGTFNRTDDGFFGNLRTLTLDKRLTILPSEESDTEKAPNYRVFCDDIAVGAAWERTGEKAGMYLAVVIDDPALAQPIRAGLFHVNGGEDAWTLHWNRTSQRT